MDREVEALAKETMLAVDRAEQQAEEYAAKWADRFVK